MIKGIRINYSKVDTNLPAFKPSKYDEGDAGIDLYARESKWVFPFMVRKIPLNICLEIPKGYFARICGRSGQTSKGTIVWAGTVDASYRGEVSAMVSGLLPKKVRRGERIAQLIIIPCMVNNSIREVSYDELSTTERGAKGFNSSGTF